MQNVEITFDKETWFYDAIILSKWIATQWKTIDEIIINIWEAVSLSENKKFQLNKFNISFDEKYVNI
jgi:uncharacterized ubiquitin-like protein YukD